MALRTCVIFSCPSVGGSGFGVVFGPLLGCHTKVRGILDRLPGRAG